LLERQRVQLRSVLFLSASEDRNSADAREIVKAAIGAWEERGARENFEHVRYNGGHALTTERSEKIIKWVTGQADR
jgi:surfactin synthase thioesterase subunit